jgi:hypothetical protein
LPLLKPGFRFRGNDGIRKTVVVKYVTVIENGSTKES